MARSEVCLEEQAEGQEGNALEKKKGLSKNLEVEVLILHFGD